MQPDLSEIKQTLTSYLVKELGDDEGSRQINDSTCLITGGFLDSISTIKLVAFLEERFKIQIRAHEMDVNYLNTILDIAKLVQDKIKKRK